MKIKCDAFIKPMFLGHLADRRHTNRIALELPVIVHGMNGELFGALTRDVSASGIYVKVRREAIPHGDIRFLLTFPQEISGSCRVLASCQGTIVRREAAGNAEGWALRIDRFESLLAVV